MNFIRKLYDWTLQKSRHPKASWFLAFISFIESSFFPIPPDIILIPMVLANKFKAWLYAFMCTNNLYKYSHLIKLCVAQMGDQNCDILLSSNRQRKYHDQKSYQNCIFESKRDFPTPRELKKSKNWKKSPKASGEEPSDIFVREIRGMH